ncbi:MAG: hypothetical protein AAGA54_21385 [Myxococcota bacterium]
MMKQQHPWFGSITLAASGATPRVGSRRFFGGGKEPKRRNSGPISSFRRRRLRRKGQARRRAELHHGLLGIALLSGLVLGACDPAADVAEQCGLDITCSGDGFLEGNASISGIASIDSFFGAAIDLDAAMVSLSASLRSRLDAIGASIGVEAGASGAEIRDRLEGFLGTYIAGDLTVDFQPAQCEASVEASVAAAAECDASVDAGEVSASCSGSCELDASAGAECSVDAELVCTGTAPNFDCTGGTCSGSCVAEFTAAATCDGTCRGTCTFDDGPEIDDFEGRCDGACEGECSTDMSAGGDCNARCEGSCEYRPGEGGCEADASARCEAKAGASIECDAGCEGSVEPPEVSAECEATVDAKASASVSCTPPSLAFSFDWAAGVTAEQQAEFRAWLEGFRANFSALVAARAEAEVVASAAINLVASAEGTLADAVGDLQGSADLVASVGAGCALLELPDAAQSLRASTQSLQANATATVEVLGAFGS